jgi:hypothetical protein
LFHAHRLWKRISETASSFIGTRSKGRQILTHDFAGQCHWRHKRKLRKRK